MKRLAGFCASLALGIAAAGVQADGEAGLELAGCASELNAYYGQDTQFEVVNKRRHRYGTKVRVAVRMDTDNTRFATCWVPGNDIAGFEEKLNEDQVATTEAGEATR